MAIKKTALSLAIGTAFAASVAIAPVASAADNPFEMDSLDDGYQVVAADKKAKEGKCGEGRCGGGSTKTKDTKSNQNGNRTK
jgi:uncharacterized low-complexity protein